MKRLGVARRSAGNGYQKGKARTFSVNYSLCYGDTATFKSLDLVKSHVMFKHKD